MQRFGRAARNMPVTAKCILLAPSGYFHEMRIKRMRLDKRKRRTLNAEALSNKKAARTVQRKAEIG